MTPQALPQPVISKHQPSVWSKLVAIRKFGSLGALVGAPEAYKRAVETRKEAIKNKKFLVVSFDTLPRQSQVLNDGNLTALIGRRAFKMGLKETTEGKKIENVDAGVGLVDASNVDQFLKK
jgi:hypothetical protein